MKYMEIIFLFTLLFGLINSNCMISEEDLLELDEKIRKYKHCQDREREEELIENNAYKCCYLYYYVDKKNYQAEVHTCLLITKDQYDNIKDTVKNYEESRDVEDVSIDCKGNITKLGFLVILSLLFF